MWTYWRPEADRIVKLGTVRGSEVGLPAHFHEEDQITFVLAGRRRFLLEGKVVHLGPGEGACIAAGAAHSSLAESQGLICFNAYLPASNYAMPELIEEITRLWRSTGYVRSADLAGIVREHRLYAGQSVSGAKSPLVSMSTHETVVEAAARAGMSREGFSRLFRRSQGIPPYAFSLTCKLKNARKLLRAGEAIAAVAAETGFADQSHLGRCFRRAFGVTPGRYRLG